MPEMRIAVITITRGGARIGQVLCESSPGLQLHVSSRYADQAGDRYTCFEPNELKTLIASLWKKHDGLVLIMATGIVVRMIAPLLESKETDPAVVVMDDAGRFAIALLSGHLGGANELAERCAFAVRAQAVITTATDANNLPSFDLLAKEQGWPRRFLFNSNCWTHPNGGASLFGPAVGAPMAVMTLEEVGEAVGCTRERVRQIQNKAIKKLQYMHSDVPPQNIKKLSDDDDTEE